jgi:dephospho-CoA kinase
MKVLIVTGGIGSGKSTVCSMLAEDYGYPVYEADRRVKELYLEHPRLLTDIEESLGETFRGEDGQFQPARLSARIFSQKEDLLKVESLVFPVLVEDFDRWKKENATKAILVLESATILEKPSLLGLGDMIMVVDAPLQLRVDRAVSRDGVDENSVRARVASQKLMNEISEGHIPENVDFVIKNDSDIETLAERLKAFVAISDK